MKHAQQRYVVVWYDGKCGFLVTTNGYAGRVTEGWYLRNYDDEGNSGILAGPYATAEDALNSQKDLK